MTILNKTLKAAAFSACLILQSIQSSQSAVLVDYDFNNFDNNPSLVEPNLTATPLFFNHLGQVYDNQNLDTRAWNRGENIYRYFDFMVNSKVNNTFDVFNLNFSAKKYTLEDFPYVNGHNNLAIQFFSNDIQIGAQVIPINNSFTSYTLPLNFIELDNFKVRFVGVPGFSDWNIVFDDINLNGNVNIIRQVPNDPSAVPEVNSLGIILFGFSALGYCFYSRNQKIKV